MTQVSQRFIDLLNVPLDVLRGVADYMDVPKPASMTKWALAEALESLPRDDLDELTGGFLYAGRTSLVFFRVDEPVKPTEARASDGVDATQAAPVQEDVILEGARP